MKNIEIKNMKVKTSKLEKGISPKIKEKQRAFGSIQIEVPESIRRKTLNKAFISLDSSMVNQEDLNVKFNEIIELDNNFKPWVFLEFLLYHLLFFFVLGPFLPIVCYPIFRNFTRFRNMCFWGITNEFFYQVFLYIVGFGALFGYFYLNSDAIYIVEILSIIKNLG